MFLEKILTKKQVEVLERKEEVPLNSLIKALDQQSYPARCFKTSINQPTISIIAEIKKASPSKGLLCPDFNPESLAQAYESAGAAAISVLTDEEFFQGSLTYLALVKAKTAKVPVLRKEFIIDEYQIVEAKVNGADAVLLIVAALEPRQLQEYIYRSNELGMATLVEVHDHEELEIALDAGASIIGINNRDLRSFTTDLNTTFKLLESIPKGITVVSESGIKDRQDIIRLENAGVQAVLVGESLVTAADPQTKISSLLGEVS